MGNGLRVIFRVDGDSGSRYGTGHVVRDLAIVDELHRIDDQIFITFLMQDIPEGINIAERGGIQPFIVPKNATGQEFEVALEALKPDILVIDLLGSTMDMITAARGKAKRVVSLDDLEDSAQHADVIVNGILWATLWLPEPFGVATVFQGVNYIPLRKDFADLARRHRSYPHRGRRILLNTGGSDIRSMTAAVIRSLSEQLADDQSITVIVGPANHRLEEIMNAASPLGDRCQVIESPSFLGDMMMEHDIAVLTGGTVMFEAAACGLPVCVVTSHAHQSPAAEYFARNGAAVHAGDLDEALPDLSTQVFTLLADQKCRKEMGRCGRNIVDGRGIERTAEIILDNTTSAKDS